MRNKINAYIKESVLKINKIFYNHDLLKRMNGIILAGNGNMKTKLYKSTFLKNNIKSLIVKIIDTNYGGQDGANELLQKFKNKNFVNGQEVKLNKRN